MQNRTPFVAITEAEYNQLLIESSSYCKSLSECPPESWVHLLAFLDVHASFYEISHILEKSESDPDFDSTQAWIAFLKNRWERIRSADIFHLPGIPTNAICYRIAERLSQLAAYQDKSLYEFLMPSLKSTVDHAFEMKLEEYTTQANFILDEKQEYPICLAILASWASRSGETRLTGYFYTLKNQMKAERMQIDYILFNIFSKKHLSKEELTALIHSTEEGAALYKQIQDYLAVINSPDSSIRHHLEKLFDLLFKSSVYNKDPQYKGTAEEADPIATKAMHDFQLVLDQLSEEEKSAVFSLRPGPEHQPIYTFGYVWDILHHKTANNENDCTGLNAERGKSMLANPDNIHILDKNIEKQKIVSALDKKINADIEKFISCDNKTRLPTFYKFDTNQLTDLLLTTLRNRRQQSQKDFYFTPFLLKFHFVKNRIEEAHLELISLLLENGATVNSIFQILTDSKTTLPKSDATSLLNHLIHHFPNKLIVTHATITWMAKNGFLSLLKETLPQYPNAIFPSPLTAPSSLMLAAQNKQLETVKFLLDWIAQDSSRRFLLTHQSNDQSALDLAILAGATDIVRELLERGATFEPSIIRQSAGETRSLLIKQLDPTTLKKQVNLAINQNLDTWLHEAVSQNDIPLITQLLEWGADPNLNNKNKQTPLHFAGKLKQSAAFELLIEHGALMSVIDNEGMSPACHAASNGNTETLKVMLTKFPEYANYASSSDGKTLLIRAILNDHFDTAQYLLSCEGVNLDSKINDPANLAIHDHNALILAISKKNLALVKAILDKGVSLETLCHNSPPITFAIIWGDMNIFELLLEKKANIQVRNSMQSTLAIFATEMDRLDMLSKMISLDRSQLNHQNQFGITPLHTAIFRNQHEIIDYLLSQADTLLDLKFLDANQKTLITALAYAIEIGDIAIIKKLLNRGATVDYQAIMKALDANNEIKDLILNAAHLSEKVKNMILTPQNHEQNSPLHEAVLMDDAELIEELIQLNAPTDLINTYGYSPLDIAVHQGKSTIFSVLKKYKRTIDIEKSISAALSTGHVNLLDAIIERNALQLSILEYLEYPGVHSSRLIHCAAAHENTEYLKWVLNKNVTASARDEFGNNAAHVASMNGRLPNLKLLLNRYPVLFHTQNYAGDHILSLADHNGHADIVDYLLHHEELDPKTPMGERALTIAAQQKKWGLYEKIKEINAGIKRKISETEDEPAAKRQKTYSDTLLTEDDFHQRVIECLESNQEKALIGLLIQKRNFVWDLNHFYSSGKDGVEDKTLLMLVCEKGWLNAAISIIKTPKEINGKINIKKTRKKSYLVRSKTNRTALHFAAESGHDHVIHYLKDCSLDPFNLSKTRDGYSILHLAIKSKKMSTVLAIINCFNKNFHNKLFSIPYSQENLTPVEFAEQLRLPEIANFLKLTQASALVSEENTTHLGTLEETEKAQWIEKLKAAIKQEAPDEILKLLSEETTFTKEKELGIYYKNQTLFMIAAQHGWLDVINKQIEMSDNIWLTKCNTLSSGKTALHFAIEAGHLNIVERLLEINIAHLNKNIKIRKNGYHRTCLMLACENGHLDIVKHLIKLNATLSGFTEKGYSAIDLAGLKQHSEIVQYFKTLSESKPTDTLLLDLLLFQTIQFGTEEEALSILSRLKNTDWNVNTTHSIQFLSDTNTDLATPLMLAAKQGQLQLIQALLTLGATQDILLSKYKTLSALHYAAKAGQVEVLKFFLQQDGKNPDSKFAETPLHLAIKAGSFAAVKLLIEKGASVFITNSSGQLPLDLATSDEITDYLAEATSPFKKTSRRHAFFMAMLRQDETEAMEYLTAYPKFKSFLNGFYTFDQTEPKTFLIFACEHNMVEVSKVLIEIGADINLQCSKTKRTALFFAAQNNDADLIYFLKQHGADLSLTVKDKKDFKLLADLPINPLSRALLEPDARPYEMRLVQAFLAADASGNILPILSLLDEENPDPGLMNKLIRSPNFIIPIGYKRHHASISFLMYASHKGWKLVVEKLISKGADPKIKSPSGRGKKFSALHFACLAEQTEIMAYLLSVCQELIHGKDKNGKTELHYAYLSDNKTMINLLEVQGADRYAKDKKNKTPIEYRLPNIRDVSFDVSFLDDFLTNLKNQETPNWISQTFPIDLQMLPQFDQDLAQMEFIPAQAPAQLPPQAQIPDQPMQIEQPTNQGVAQLGLFQAPAQLPPQAQIPDQLMQIEQPAQQGVAQLGLFQAQAPLSPQAQEPNPAPQPELILNPNTDFDIDFLDFDLDLDTGLLQNPNWF